MDDSEKLMALKKAYADIILNTAKEAAARIMISERKAMRSQQELASTKEEALRMLLRLKQMMDSKVKEAELMSSSQQKKIDELEAQLQEAEEIVRDLRAELSEARTELENLTNHQMHPPIEQNIEGEVATPENCLQEKRLDPYDGSVHPIPGSQVESATISDLKNPNVNGTNGSSKFCVSHDRTNNCYIHNPDFASIVIRKKEPELFRNGCTQRIRAFERSLFDGNMSVSGNSDNVHDETLDRVHEEGKAMPATTNAKANTPCEEKKPDELKVVKADADLVKNPYRKLRRSNKARPCVLKTNDPSRAKSSIVECENEAQKDLVRVHKEGKVMPVPTNAQADTICEKEKPDKLIVVEENADLVKVPVGKTSSVVIRLHPDEVKKTSKASYLSDAKGSACELDGNDPSMVNSSMEHENEAQKDIMSSFTEAPIDKTATIEQSGSHHDIEKGEAFINNACNTLNKIKDEEELFDKLDLARPESLSTESLEVPACRADVEEANGSPGKLDTKASDLDAKVSCQSANDKFLKYTFQRKRKKESVTSADVDCSLENRSLKKCGEKQNGHVEPQKSCPMTVTSADVDCSLGNCSLKKSGEKQNGHVEPQKSCTVTSADVDCSVENRSLKKKCGEKQNDHVEPQKSCPMTESSRDSRRLAQVARQLISLSEKKW